MWQTVARCVAHNYLVKTMLHRLCVSVCVRTFACMHVWFCWYSWGIKRSIYPETSSAFLHISGESDSTPGLLPYSALPLLSRFAFTHKSLANPFLPKRQLILTFSIGQLACSSELLVIPLNPWVCSQLFLMRSNVSNRLSIARQSGGLDAVFESTVGHTRRPCPSWPCLSTPITSPVLSKCVTLLTIISVYITSTVSWSPRSKRF